MKCDVDKRFKVNIRGIVPVYVESRNFWTDVALTLKLALGG